MATQNLLLDLIPELLDPILAQLLVSDKQPIVVPAEEGIYAGLERLGSIHVISPGVSKFQPSILGVCKDLHRIGSDLLYRRNRYHFLGPHGLVNFGDRIGARNAALITQISIHALNLHFKCPVSRAITINYPNLTRVTIDERHSGEGMVFRYRTDPIISKEELQEAMGLDDNSQCQIHIFPMPRRARTGIGAGRGQSMSG
ncbi:hypothetical protein MMC11_000992 [Xylographa trunciseda]|nr:hypothetical protein [Xylographa trunciseda]